MTNVIMNNGMTATAAFKSQINDLIQLTFGFSFEKWHKRNLWDDQYERYSIIDGDKIAANISVFKVKLLIHGETRNFLQLGSVATREEYRGKGLARKIMEHIFELYPDTPMFLHANESVTEFYPRFGFKPFTYKQPYLKTGCLHGNGMIKLNLTDPKVDYYLKSRAQYSRIFDCLSPYSINWFHLIYFHADHLYELPGLDAMLIAEQRGNVLFIYDIIAAKNISISQVLPLLNFPGADTIEFGFTPDWLEADYSMREMELDHPFIRGDFGVNGNFRMPELLLT
ncbi:GNAT family N-acetyltransferase [Gorillibacterium massiliense]|uniref:GNAT family N-acetyltransferase n=1 Tax=Gorillibacterium massiliense TaxID=1280390 RepID=UPI0004B00ABC|nr:GNAT family N-acetyltransferase [Gorillibacterium massiliense]